MAKRSEPAAKITEFSGLNNKAEPRTMQPGELVQADNIDIDDRKRIRRRRDERSVLPLVNLTSAWTTPDEERLFLVGDGVLYEVVGDTYALITLASGLSDDETYWATDGELVYCSNTWGDYVIGREGAYPLALPEVDTPLMHIISGDLPPGRYLAACTVLDSRGREGPASQIVVVTLDATGGLQFEQPTVPAGYTVNYYLSRTNGDDLYRATQQVRDSGSLNQIMEEPLYSGNSPLPGGPIAWSNGRLVKGLNVTEGDTGMVTFSYPYWAHLFALGKEDFLVPGRVVALADVDQKGLLIGTTRRIMGRTPDGVLDTLADYGAVGGHTMATDDKGMVYFWTHQGMCRAFPFENLTETVLSAPGGTRCAVGIVKEGGFERVMAVTEGLSTETPENPRDDRYRWRQSQ